MVDGQFLFEDFRGAVDGDVPRGWNASDRMLVTGLGRERALQVTSGTGDASAVISGIAFPPNFTLQLTVVMPDICHARIEVTAGDLYFRAGGDCRSVVLLEEERGGDWDNQRHALTIEKKGNVLKLFVDGKERIVVRKTSINVAGVARLKLQGGARIFELRGTALP